MLGGVKRRFVLVVDVAALVFRSCVAARSGLEKHRTAALTLKCLSLEPSLRLNPLGTYAYYSSASKSGHLSANEAMRGVFLSTELR